MKMMYPKCIKSKTLQGSWQVKGVAKMPTDNLLHRAEHLSDYNNFNMTLEQSGSYSPKDHDRP